MKWQVLLLLAAFLLITSAEPVGAVDLTVIPTNGSQWLTFGRMFGGEAGIELHEIYIEAVKAGYQEIVRAHTKVVQNDPRRRNPGQMSGFYDAERELEKYLNQNSAGTCQPLINELVSDLDQFTANPVRKIADNLCRKGYFDGIIIGLRWQQIMLFERLELVKDCPRPSATDISQFYSEEKYQGLDLRDAYLLVSMQACFKESDQMRYIYYRDLIIKYPDTWDERIP